MRLGLLGLLLTACSQTPAPPTLVFNCVDGVCLLNTGRGAAQSTAWCVPTGPSWLCYDTAVTCKKERRPEWSACRRVTPDEMIYR